MISTSPYQPGGSFSNIKIAYSDTFTDEDKEALSLVNKHHVIDQLLCDGIIFQKCKVNAVKFTKEPIMLQDIFIIEFDCEEQMRFEYPKTPKPYTHAEDTEVQHV